MIWHIYRYIFLLNTLSGGKSCLVASGEAVPPWATETVLSPRLAVDEDRISHVFSHVVWWRKKKFKQVLLMTMEHCLIQKKFFFPTERFQTKRWKRSKRQFQNKMIQIVKTEKNQTINSKLPYPIYRPKVWSKALGRRYGTIPLPFRSRFKKNNKGTWKNILRNTKLCHCL